MKYLRISLAATFALLLLAGCGSTLNDVLGTGTGTTPTNTQSYSGNVNYIDLNARRIDLNSNGYTTSIYYDSNTQFTYQNQNVNPNSIRTGDYVTIQAYNNGNGQLTAQNVSDNGSMASGTYPPSSSSGFHIQGTVSYVDTGAQRIDITSAYTTGLNTGGSGQGSYSVYYSTSTPVYYQGNTYSPTALERGDQIDISASNNGGRYQANSINVTRNVRQ